MASRLYNEIVRRAEALNMDAATVSKKAGLGPSYVRDLGRKDTKEPRASAIAAIAQVLGCDPAELPQKTRHNVFISHSSADTVRINELDIHFAAGAGMTETAGRIILDTNYITGVHTYPAASFREAYGINPGNIRIIPVRGTSMEPELWSGQRVMVDIEDKTPSPPGVFAVWDGLGLALKYVEVIPGSDPLRVRISSAHSAFKPYECAVNEANINGRVIGVWKRM